MTIDRGRIEVRAMELTGAEREEMWRALGDVWPRIDAYERFRLIPVVGSPSEASTGCGR